MGCGGSSFSMSAIRTAWSCRGRCSRWQELDAHKVFRLRVKEGSQQANLAGRSQADEGFSEPPVDKRSVPVYATVIVTK